MLFLSRAHCKISLFTVTECIYPVEINQNEMKIKLDALHILCLWPQISKGVPLYYLYEYCFPVFSS